MTWDALAYSTKSLQILVSAGFYVFNILPQFG